MGTTPLPAFGYTRAKVYRIGSVYARVFRNTPCDDPEYSHRAMAIFQPYILVADRCARTVKNMNIYLNDFAEKKSAEIRKIKEKRDKEQDEAKKLELTQQIDALEAEIDEEEKKTKNEIREYENELVSVPAFPAEKEFLDFIKERKVYKLSAGDLYDLFVFVKNQSDDAKEDA